MVVTAPEEVLNRIAGISPPVAYYDRIWAVDAYNEPYEKEIGDGGFLINIEWARSGSGDADEQYFTQLSTFLSRLNRADAYFSLPVTYGALANLIPTIPTTSPVPRVTHVGTGSNKGEYTLNVNAPDDGVYCTDDNIRIFQVESLAPSFPRKVRIFPNYTLTANSSDLNRVTSLNLKLKRLRHFADERVVTKVFGEVDFRQIVEFKVV